MLKKEYDVIIIGGGIGGLVCGCYLIRKGLKTLIIEKNDTLGGYVDTFRCNGYSFNTCIRGMVGCATGGAFNRVLTDLGLEHKLDFIRPPVYDDIHFFKKKVGLHNNVEETIDEIIRQFPKEKKAVNEFFQLLRDDSAITEIYKYRRLSFQKLLNEYFKEKELKFLFSAMRIDSGLMPSRTSAIADFMLIKGNILDGGYLPNGGMKSLVELFAKYFKEKGGHVILNTFIKKIKLNKYKAEGVLSSDDLFFGAKVIVSNIDATYTFNSLLGRGNVSDKFLDEINAMEPSASVFLIYLGLGKPIKSYFRYNCSAVWHFNKSLAGGIVCLPASLIDSSFAPQNASSVTAYFGVRFEDEQYWIANKARIADIFIKRLNRILPISRRDIKLLAINSPYDLYKKTLNRDGASRGWSPCIKQFNNFFPPFQTHVENVFLAGHWVASAVGNGGVTFSALIGKKVANYIVNNHNNVAQ
ncbi:MAG TPA: hypothetical protein DCL35_06750 [Candidatus Omnitrophica bacterium]|nr:hypothetical protein [Candidatus Omnitrophota bacterium]